MITVYEESILSSMSALRAFYGLNSEYNAEKRLSEYIRRRNPKRIFLMLVDGMGANLIAQKLPKEAFLNQHMLYKTETVFPPTTTAATTSILNGKAPNKNAWLGWSMYFKEVDDEIIPFFGKGLYSAKDYGPDFVYKALPVKTMVEECNEKGFKARELYPSFREDGCETFTEMIDRLIGFGHSGEYDFIYAYWDAYDSLMHKLGPSSEQADEMLKDINGEIERLAQNLDEDTMVMVIADHGQVDIHRDYNLANSPYKAYFSGRPSVEPRAMAFRIKEECRDEFARHFKEEFENDYVLLSKEEVLKTGLFGPGENHPRFEDFIGDYLAIAKSDLCLSYKEEGESFRFRGQHAGMNEDERMIPVIVF